MLHHKCDLFHGTSWAMQVTKITVMMQRKHPSVHGKCTDGCFLERLAGMTVKITLLVPEYMDNY